MKIAISAESTIDLTKELLSKYDIKIVPFNIQLGEKAGFDGEITTDEIISYVTKRAHFPKQVRLMSLDLTSILKNF